MLCYTCKYLGDATGYKNSDLSIYNDFCQCIINALYVVKDIKMYESNVIRYAQYLPPSVCALYVEGEGCLPVINRLLYKKD